MYLSCSDGLRIFGWHYEAKEQERDEEKKVILRPPTKIGELCSQPVGAGKKEWITSKEAD
jgi:hypothetical protein